MPRPDVHTVPTKYRGDLRVWTDSDRDEVVLEDHEGTRWRLTGAQTTTLQRALLEANVLRRCTRWA